MMTAEQFKHVIEAIEQGNWRLLWLLISVVVVCSFAILIQVYWTKRIEAAVANRQHFSRLRYEREIEIYRDVWKKLFDFYESTTKLGIRVAHESPALREWTEKRNDLVEVIRYTRPFYPKEIWSELQTAQILCEEVARAKEHSISALETESNNWVELKKKIQSQKDKVAEAIRERLSKFDGA
jgi:hypothetical protein